MRIYVILGCLALLVIGLLQFCAPEIARRALEGAGYSDIEIGMWKPVTGVVCSGLVTGSVIRLD